MGQMGFDFGYVHPTPLCLHCGVFTDNPDHQGLPRHQRNLRNFLRSLSPDSMQDAADLRGITVAALRAELAEHAEEDAAPPTDEEQDGEEAGPFILKSLEKKRLLALAESSAGRPTDDYDGRVPSGLTCPPCERRIGDYIENRQQDMSYMPEYPFSGPPPHCDWCGGPMPPPPSVRWFVAALEFLHWPARSVKWGSGSRVMISGEASWRAALATGTDNDRWYILSALRKPPVWVVDDDAIHAMQDAYLAAEAHANAAVPAPPEASRAREVTAFPREGAWPTMETISQAEIDRLVGPMAETDTDGLALVRAIDELRAGGDTDGLRRLGAALEEHATQLEILAGAREEALEGIPAEAVDRSVMTPDEMRAGAARIRAASYPSNPPPLACPDCWEQGRGLRNDGYFFESTRPWAHCSVDGIRWRLPTRIPLELFVKGPPDR